jgi:hypothetical protein
MAPSILHVAGSAPAAAFQTGALSVTAETGSPIDETGIATPSLSAEQSDSVIILLAANAGNFEPGAGMDATAATVAGRDCPHTKPSAQSARIETPTRFLFFIGAYYTWIW